jgi:peptidoglycan/xylan/chitin deacetylase (PgdA/CDA1 family)
LRIALGVIILAVATLKSYPAETALRPKIVAFTFDDGPRPEFLLRALPYFAKENIPVTFFVIGGKANKYPEWIKREFREGHEIENHTMNHVCLAKPSPRWTACPDISSEQAIAEVKRAMDVIEKLTGYRTRFVRPPHFAMTRERKREIESALNVRVLAHGSASIGSLDWVYRDPEKVVAEITNTFKSRGDGAYVIVFHENDVTLEALPLIIKFFRSRGYEFVRLDEFVKRAPKADI